MLDTQKKVIQDEKVVNAIVEGMQEKKATNVVVLDLRDIPHAVAAYFVICSANSDTQAEAIMSGVEAQVERHCNESPWHIEGIDNKEWILLDYVSVVTHIFLKSKRGFYALEDLWGDAKVSEIPGFDT